MTRQQRFDLGSGDVLASDLQHVLEPAVEHHMPMLVQSADVSTVEPTLRVQGLGGFFRVAVVTVEQVVTANQHFSALTHRQFLARFGVDDANFLANQRQAKAAETEFRIHAPVGGRDDAGGLGHTEGAGL
ncbi:hypothetical protein D3C71_1858000 [compost metagenome]